MSTDIDTHTPDMSSFPSKSSFTSPKSSFTKIGKVVHEGIVFKFCESADVLQIRVPCRVPDQQVNLVLRTYQDGLKDNEVVLDISHAVQDGLKYVKGAYVIPNEFNQRTDGSYRDVPPRWWTQVKSWATWGLLNGTTLNVKLAQGGAVGFLIVGKNLPKVVFVMQGVAVPRATDGKLFPLFVDVPKRIAHLVKLQNQMHEEVRPYVAPTVIEAAARDIAEGRMTLDDLRWIGDEEPMSEPRFRDFQELSRARRVPLGPPTPRGSDGEDGE